MEVEAGATVILSMFGAYADGLPNVMVCTPAFSRTIMEGGVLREVTDEDL